MDARKKAFYEYHCSLMEPWDGPAAIAFTDGRVIGATLDRNGLRPRATWLLTTASWCFFRSGRAAHEARERETEGPSAAGPHVPARPGAGPHRLRRGNQRTAGYAPAYGDWLKEYQITLDTLPEPPRIHRSEHSTIAQRQRAFGYTDEDVRILMTPMAVTAKSRSAPWVSIRRCLPLDKPQPLFNYFKQLFAQVTNPPIDPSARRW